MAKKLGRPRTPVVNNHKECKQCGETKHLDEYSSFIGYNGVRYWAGVCKKCKCKNALEIQARFRSRGYNKGCYIPLKKNENQQL